MLGLSLKIRRSYTQTNMIALFRSAGFFFVFSPVGAVSTETVERALILAVVAGFWQQLTLTTWTLDASLMARKATDGIPDRFDAGWGVAVVA